PAPPPTRAGNQGLHRQTDRRRKKPTRRYPADQALPRPPSLSATAKPGAASGLTGHRSFIPARWPRRTNTPRTWAATSGLGSNSDLNPHSLDYHEERLPLFDEIRGELCRVAAAYVLHCVDRFGRDEQDVARVVRRRRLTFDLGLQRPFEDIDDLFARIVVFHGRRLGADVDSVLDDLTSRDAEVVLLKICALDAWRLLHGAAHVSLIVSLLVADI